VNCTFQAVEAQNQVSGI